jgi:lipopolysaccharide/colanic/teichoic acid biosynthesis glycosyltransferase
MLTRLFDIFLSFIGICILSPLFILISIFIVADSRGGIFFRQSRVGKDGKDFTLLKFRTMTTGADKQGLLTVGGKDNRITKVGYFLRKYKLDELPQLFNVLIGEMSLVGPRPEVRKYVDMYNAKQLRVLSVLPGITDYASIEYSDENDLLGASADPEKTYITEILPAKINMALKYVDEPSLRAYLGIIFKTFAKILR